MEAQAQTSTRIQDLPRSRAKLRVCVAPKQHHGYLCSKLSYLPTPGFCALEAFDPETGKIWGMVGYDWWTQNSVQMHVVLEQPFVALTLIRPAFELVFNEAKRKVAIGIVASDNERALRFDQWMGFKETHRIKDGLCDGVDNVLLEMRREDCRFLKGLHK